MKTFLRAVCAGAAIALGGTVYLSCQDKVVGAFLFSVGLITVLAFGFDLFTGKACNGDYLKKPGTLALIWLGNFVGAAFFGLMVSTHGALYETASAVTAAKLDKPVYIIIIDGLICELCIAIAVCGYKKAEGFGKYLVVILGVMVFILCGSEHVVADMFYLAAARTVRLLDAVVFLALTTVGNVLGGIVWWLAMKHCTQE